MSRPAPWSPMAAPPLPCRDDRPDQFNGWPVELLIEVCDRFERQIGGAYELIAHRIRLDHDLPKRAER